MAIDERAKKILFDMHWTSKGWIDRSQRPLPPDFEYAKAQGMMFDPLTIDHDALVDRTATAMEALRLEDVTGAFLASLVTRRLDLRSALASYSLASASATRHAFRAGEDGSCAVCWASPQYQDEDLNVLNFERHKWGGVRHYYPIYRLLDLEGLVRELPIEVPKAAKTAFEQMLVAIDRAGSKDRAAKLSDAFEHVPSNKNERNTLVDLLSACGVLVAKAERDTESEFSFAADWRGEDGYDRDAVKRLFGMHGIKVTAPPKRASSNASTRKVTKRPAKKKPARKPAKKAARQKRR